MTESKEEDHLRYEGNKVPRLIRFCWTLFFIFMVYYLLKFMWPDLLDWI